jgi:5-methylcytosine-specific restriction endonuclease McrA
MSRPVPEWIGRKDTTPPPTRVKLRIITAQEGVCACGCGVKLGLAGEPVEFDHTVALINGGENRESNLRALRKPCHRVKTISDVAEKATVNRKKVKRYGLKQSKSKLPGGKEDKWKRKVGGPTVPRD